MKKTVDEINKMIMEDAPMEEINDAIGYIDICSCFDPIFEPPIDFLDGNEPLTDKVKRLIFSDKGVIC